MILDTDPEFLKALQKKTYSLNDSLNKAKKAKNPNKATIDRLSSELCIYRERLNSLFETKDLLGEEWRHVEGLANYQISNLGRVKGHKGRLLKVGISGKGNNIYPSIHVFYGNRKSGTRYIHRLLAQAFIPNPENKPQVNHIDGNKFNFKLSNLEWCTGQENMQHAVKNRLVLSGENQKSAKLTNDQVRELRKIKRENPKVTYQELADKYGIDNSNAYRTVIGVNYRYVE